MQKLMMSAALVAGLLLTFLRQSGAAPTCVVNDTGQTTCVVNVTGHGNPTDCHATDEAFTTIQDVIQFLPEEQNPGAPNRLILVCPGTYNTGLDGGARVNVRKNALTIVSTHGPRVTRISGPFTYGFLINAHRVTIEGFTVVGEKPQAPVYGRNIGIYVYGGHENRVLRNVVRNASTLGICIGSNENIVEGNEVYHNGHGIVLGHATTPSSPFIGCEVHTGDANILINNTVRHNDSTGILVYGSNRNRVVGNDVHGNETGMAILPGATTVPTLTSVEANSVHGNDTGVVEQGNFTRCDGNNMRHNHDGNPPQGACASEPALLR